MNNGYLISHETRAALQELLDASPGSSGGMRPVQPTAKTITFVEITGDMSGLRYPCTVKARSQAGGWVSYTTDAFVFPANSGDALQTGRRYAAIRTGDDSDGKPQFVAISSAAAGGDGGTCSHWVEVVTGITCGGGSMTYTTKWVATCGESDTDPST